MNNTTEEITTILKDQMKKAAEEKITPASTNMVCNCADKITGLLRLELDVKIHDKSVGAAG